MTYLYWKKVNTHIVCTLFSLSDEIVYGDVVRLRSSKKGHYRANCYYGALVRPTYSHSIEDAIKDIENYCTENSHKIYDDKIKIVSEEEAKKLLLLK